MGILYRYIIITPLLGRDMFIMPEKPMRYHSSWRVLTPAKREGLLLEITEDHSQPGVLRSLPLRS